MTTDHNELRALALAATPGPWRVGRGSKSRIYAPYHVQPDGHAIARTYGSELNGIGVADLTGPVNIADAAYIAAANPATVLALLDQAANHCEDERRMVPEHFRDAAKMVGESK